MIKIYDKVHMYELPDMGELFRKGGCHKISKILS